MKPVKAWAVVPKFSEIADVIAESTYGAMIAFFPTLGEAEQWRGWTNRESNTKTVQVEIREVKRKKRGTTNGQS